MSDTAIIELVLELLRARLPDDLVETTDMLMGDYAAQFHLLRPFGKTTFVQGVGEKMLRNMPPEDIAAWIAERFEYQQQRDEAT